METNIFPLRVALLRREATIFMSQLSPLVLNKVIKRIKKKKKKKKKNENSCWNGDSIKTTSPFWLFILLPIRSRNTKRKLYIDS